MKLAGEERQRLTRHYTANSEAYQLYLESHILGPGDPLYRRRTFRCGSTTYKTRLLKIPASRGHILNLPRRTNYPSFSEIFAGGHEGLEKQKDAARRALEIDDGLGEAHVELANALWGEWDWVGAEREFKRGIELNTNSAHTDYGRFLAQTGRTQEAIIEGQKAVEIDPLSPDTLTNVAFLYWMTRRYDLGVGERSKGVGGQTNRRGLYALKGKGQYQEAVTE